jgi:CheY-like chemotaxis protein
MPYAYIIDDSRPTAESLAQMLGLLGYEARIALGPLPALEALARRVPEVIFLDLHMNGVDGLEVCRYIRREPRTRGVYIIAMSTDNQLGVDELARAAGADCFLAKPLDLESLEAALQPAAARVANGG